MNMRKKGVQGSDSKLRFGKMKISRRTILYIIGTVTTRKTLRVMYNILAQRGHPSGWPKLPAGPPKLLEVLNSIGEVLYESEISLTRNGRFFEKM